MQKYWKAKWIKSREFEGLAPINVFHKQNDNAVLPEHMENLKNYHMLARRKFNLQKGIETAFIDISADDYYKLYINGKFVAQGPAPCYYFHYYFNRIDISKFLKAGENVIAVHVYYQGLINRVWNSGDYRQGLIAELFIDNELELFTDTEWKYKKAEEYLQGSETLGYDTQFSENIDSRLKEKSWKEVWYNDELWQNTVENTGDDHKLFLQPTPTLDVYEIKPQKTITLKNGHYLVDFGHEITGQFQMTAHGKAGQLVKVFCAEELIDEEHVRYQMRCNCNYSDTWILSGEEDILEQYDYKAFRYVEIIAPENTLNTESFSALARHYPMKESECFFDISDPLLKDIWEMCKNGVKYGSQEVYVDCPSREKGQYLGDATVTSHSQIYLSGDLRLFKKTLQDFALSTFICPGMMAVAPGSYMQEIADFSLQWPIQLQNYYMQSGDIDFLREMYPVAAGIIDHFKKYQRPDGLIENVKGKWNLVDWPQELRDGYDFDLSTIVGDGCHNVINAFYIGAVKTVDEIRTILGMNMTGEFERLKESFLKAFFREDLMLFADSVISNHAALHSNILPLYFGLVPEDAVNSIIELIKTKRFSCGVYTSYFLLKGLARIGKYELVYELLTSCEEHSWANMLKEGATTCFEAWGKEQKWNTSLCHPWASSPISVIVEDIIGLKPLKAGWEEVSFTPHLHESIKYFELRITTVIGTIYACFRDGKYVLKINDKPV